MPNLLWYEIALFYRRDMKTVKENIVLVMTNNKNYIELESSGYELTGNWLYSIPDKGEPCIHVQMSDGEGFFHVTEDKFRFTTIYRYTRNELKPTSGTNILELISTWAVIAAILALSVVGSVTLLSKYIL